MELDAGTQLARDQVRRFTREGMLEGRSNIWLGTYLLASKERDRRQHSRMDGKA